MRGTLTPIVGCCCWLTLLCGAAATFTVTNINDSGPGSFRQAITSANSTPGADRIEFNIPGSGVHTIAPTTVLPVITNQVFIDGFSQPGSSANTSASGDNSVHLIRLDGSKCLDSFPEALKFTTASSFAASPASGSTVRGLCIVRFYHGIAANEISNLTISGNWIGLDVDGVARGNGDAGIYLNTFFNFAANNLIGGATPAARNIISGNVTGAGSGGISLSGAKLVNSFIQGNFIGTDQTGTLPRGNAFSGIYVSGCSNILIGGASSSARNIVSATTAAGGHGITVSGVNVIIQGNYIGTDVSGQYDLGNLYDGVNVSSATGTKILSNLVANNRNNGINLGFNAYGTAVENNLIGTDNTGTRPLGNAYAGITVSGSTNRIGGLSPGQPNTIFYNGGAGVEINNTTAVQNEISGNSIYDNGGLGIDLGALGVTANDPADIDSGGNLLQNSPILTNAVITYGALQIQGGINTTPNSILRIECFASPGFDASGISEGQMYLGSVSVLTDGNGDASFSASVNSVPPSNYLLTATATDANGNTSEFSSPGLPIVVESLQAPALVTQKIGGAAVIMWPSAAGGYQLESTTSLSPTSAWQTVTSGIVTVSPWSSFIVTNVAAAGKAFYRLKKP